MTARLRRLFGSDALSGRFMRYLLVGGSAAFVDLGGFALLREADFDIPVAAAVSFVFAAVYNFTLSSAIVFQVDLTWRRFMMFLAFALLGLVVNTGVTSLVAVWLADMLAKITGIGVAFGMNFWMNNSLVFRQE